VTPAEVLSELRRLVPDHDRLWEAIEARRSALRVAGKPSGSVAAAYDLLADLRTDRA